MNILANIHDVHKKEASSFLVITMYGYCDFYNFFAHELRWQSPTQLLNLTTTPEPFLLCDDVIICYVGCCW